LIHRGVQTRPRDFFWQFNFKLRFLLKSLIVVDHLFADNKDEEMPCCTIRRSNRCFCLQHYPPNLLYACWHLAWLLGIDPCVTEAQAHNQKVDIIRPVAGTARSQLFFSRDMRHSAMAKIMAAFSPFHLQHPQDSNLL
jgi:hypothetical protein